MKEIKTVPSAGALIESLRDIGYTFESALADIVDNSITAQARNISIKLDLSDDSCPTIVIVDDGVGMSRDQLLWAMKPGSQNPLHSRDKDDLGRFGLGLKTASFSQCRKLTVITRQKGITTGASWDLDRVAELNEWMLQLLDDTDIHKHPIGNQLTNDGTAILWENLDRLQDATGKTSLKNHLYQCLENAEKHLSLVFHRFITGERPFSKISLSINSRPLVPFDPFNSGHPATIRQREEEILVDGQSIKVQPFILPHHKKATRTVWEKYGGDAGYLKNQGFYVYRAGRLIIHGTWFRLAKQCELTKLARVRIDMPNGLDHLWKIDVKKSSAQPPLLVRERLKRIISEISGASNRVYTAKGRRITDSNVTSLWNRRIDKNVIHYELNRDHPNIAGIMSSLSDIHKKQLNCLLEAVEHTFPVDALFSDASGQPESLASNAIADESLVELVRTSFSLLKSQGLEMEKISSCLQTIEPYRSNWEKTVAILSAITQEANNDDPTKQ